MVTVNAFKGLRGTDDWVANQRPQDYMQTIALLEPNGEMPLTNLTTMAGPQRTTDPIFHHPTKALPTQRATVTGGPYVDTGLASLYSTGGVDGNVLYFKVAAIDAAQFRKNHTVRIRKASDYRLDTFGLVRDVVPNGAISYIAVRLLEDDDNHPTLKLAAADTLLIVGNANSEGAPMPTSIAYDITYRTGYCQIFRSSLEMTATAMATNLRTNPDAYAEAKREAMQLYGLEIEKALIWGERKQISGENGKPMRFTQGLISVTKEYADTNNVDDFTLNTDYAGKNWTDVDGGMAWLKHRLRYILRFGAREKLAVCGDGALLGIDMLVQSAGDMRLEVGQTQFGMDIHRWLTPFGSILLKVHPLFSYEATNTNSMLIYEPSMVHRRELRPTKFIPDSNRLRSASEGIGLDGIKEEWRGEFGFAYDFAETFGYLNGVGLDNNLAP